MMKQFSDFLLKLYRGVTYIPTGEFKDWALNETKLLIPFDTSVCWTDIQNSRETDRQGIRIHLHNLDYEFISSWLLYRHDDKLPLAQHLNIDQAFNVNVTSSYSDTDLLDYHYKRFGIEHIVSMATINSDTRLLHTISLHRSNINQPFTEIERALTEVIFSHLFEAVNKNWLANLPQLFPGNQCNNLSSIATCNSCGILQFALPAFIATCRHEWPKWMGPTLPEVVKLSMQNGSLKFIGRKIVISMSHLNDLFLLRARPKLAADELSLRELEVALKFASGSDYKTIALELSVSPSTIKGHLNKIYTKLEINEKASLVTEIRRITH